MASNIDKKEGLERIIEENLFSQPFMVELVGEDPEHDFDYDTTSDTDDNRIMITKDQIILEVKAGPDSIGKIESDYEIYHNLVKGWAKKYDMDVYFDSILTGDDNITFVFDVPGEKDKWDPEMYLDKKDANGKIPEDINEGDFVRSSSLKADGKVEGFWGTGKAKRAKVFIPSTGDTELLILSDISRIDKIGGDLMYKNTKKDKLSEPSKKPDEVTYTYEDLDKFRYKSIHIPSSLYPNEDRSLRTTLGQYIEKLLQSSDLIEDVTDEPLEVKKAAKVAAKKYDVPVIISEALIMQYLKYSKETIKRFLSKNKAADGTEIGTYDSEIDILNYLSESYPRYTDQLLVEDNNGEEVSDEYYNEVFLIMVDDVREKFTLENEQDANHYVEKHMSGWKAANGASIGYDLIEDYKDNLDTALIQKYAISLKDMDITNEDIKILIAENSGIDDLMNAIADKNNLIPVSTTIRVKIAEKYICIIKDQDGNEIGSYYVSKTDEYYLNQFFNAIGIKLRDTDTKEIVTS